MKAMQQAPAVWSPPRFDGDLVSKYDVPAPRYTSYPTAPCFRDDFGADDYRNLLRASAAAGRPLSIYVHVPFCETRCFFCGCNVSISRNRDRASRYLETVGREIDAVAALLGEGREVVQIHWGGGTPNFLPPDQLATLGALVTRPFSRHRELEFGVEIDPRRCDEAQLDAFTAAGVNRLSLGVQDVDPEVQRAINRVQPMELTRAVVDGARRRGIGSINVDLIYGLPLQTPGGFADTIDRVLELDPDRLAVFNFAYLPEMLAHQRVIDPRTLPTPEAKLEILELVISRLTAAGYVFIGLDHFAKPDDPLAAALADGTMTRNFQGYSTWGGVDLVAFGSSAIGQVAGGYAQNERLVPGYQQAVDGAGLATVRGLVTSAEDELRRDVIVDLMCRFRVDTAEIGERHGVDFETHFADELRRLAPLADDDLVAVRPGTIEVTPLGRLLVRNVAAVFDEYLRPGGAAAGFSRTV